MMKHLLFLFMSTLFVPVLAQQYHPILEDGKSWHYTNYDNMGENPYEYSYALHGDTIIDGQRYAAYRNERGNASSLFREEGGKVYVYSLYYKKERLLYDFTLSEGDLFNSDGNGNGLFVASVDTVRVFGSPRKCLHLCLKWQYGNGMEGIDYDNPVVWVEGMGSDRGLLNTYPIAPNDYEYLNYIEMPDGRKYDFTQIGEQVKFVEEGKVWTYFRTDPPAYMHFFSLFIQGDTIMGGKECKKLYGDHYDYHVPYEPICFLGGLYEEEGKVYLVDNVYNTTDQWVHELLYDFSHQVGDTFTVDNERYHLKLVEIREGEDHHGRDYKAHVLQWDSDRDGWNLGYKYVTWIEGIGSTYQDLFEVCPTMGKNGFLTSVTLNGDTLYSRDLPEVFKEMLGVKHVTTDESQLSDKKYDVSGRQIKEARKGQIMISDGKKFVAQ
jgi:hypothetical protein